MIISDNTHTYEKVENIKRPLVVGEILNVACLVKRGVFDKITSFIPVINKPHSDKENGQPETHYHTDYRFVLTEEDMNGYGYSVIDERDGFKSAEKGRVELFIDGELEFHNLPVITDNHNGLAQRFFIRNSKLKHKCIHKGRCPHRGYDLSQEKAVNGIITCPLHALEFHSDSGKITDEILEELELYRKRELEYKSQLSVGLKKINKIKDGDIITQKEYDELNKYPLNSLYSVYQILNGKYYDFEWTKVMNYPPKELDKKTTLKFKVLM